MEAVLATREWLAGDRFSVADLLMADVLRPVDRFDGLAPYPACRAYLARARSGVLAFNAGRKSLPSPTTMGITVTVQLIKA